LTPHGLEHVRVDVLERHVHRARDLGVPRIAAISSSLQCAGACRGDGPEIADVRQFVEELHEDAPGEVRLPGAAGPFLAKDPCQNTWCPADEVDPTPSANKLLDWRMTITGGWWCSSRICGITQKLHGWLQPSAIFT